MNIVFWGATGQAKVLRELLDPSIALVALFDNLETVASPFVDVPVFHGRGGFRGWHEAHRDPALRCLVAIGGERIIRP